MVVAKTFKALGDPVRLEILERLSNGATHTLGSVSSGLGLTRQGARKHLQVLTNADLVSLQTMGRETQVKLDAESLATARGFITELELRWDRRLQSLCEFVEGEEPTASHNSASSSQ